ncbi:hypothetical protein [uncultured Shewanella sp.]|uniref:hypothetical protein n=1 Tax=uncultured Shewanella sp. TaxID=173975 RepID=UPI002604694F|nr:hypothetical protein [uncultured Shewanella sp.]
MLVGLLPNFMKFTTALDLVRVGRDYDGGYLVSKSDIDKSDVLIGLGINDDWSFESDFCQYNDVPVYAYDASVSKKVFFKNIKNAFRRFHRPKPLLHWIKVYNSYKKFFTGNKHHIEKFVGLNAGGVHCSMDEVFKDTDYKNIFLKIDIESSEYRILESLIENQDRITGMAIEFHYCDVHLERIRSFIERFKLPLVHIHANNIAAIRIDDSLPSVLELTFSQYAKTGSNMSMPHELDMPNSEKFDEIALRVVE